MQTIFLDERLTQLKSLISLMGGCVEQMLQEASLITLDKTADKDKLYKLIQDREQEIDDLQIKLGKYCFRILARQAPVARDLRMILSIISINTALERMGDLSLNISRKAKDLKQDPLLETPFEKLNDMFHQITSMIRSCLNSFVNEDAKLAQQVIAEDRNIDKLKDKIYIKLRDCILSNNDLVDTCLQLVSISEKLERLGDQATNVAEEVIFLKTGRDVKHKKPSKK